MSMQRWLPTTCISVSGMLRSTTDMRGANAWNASHWLVLPNVRRDRAADPACIAYLGVGPIFTTGRKADAGPPIGPQGVRAVVALTSLPVAAIGGIALAGVPVVRETGATTAAIISALYAAENVAAKARSFVAAWDR